VPAAGDSDSQHNRAVSTLSGVTMPDERQQRHDLRRMKTVAAALLLLAALAYVLARRAEADGAGWVGYVRAGAEAAMVGALADWFAVTALFRHPLGLPIPHTAIIPTRKDQLGRGLSSFVGVNFLSEQVVHDRLRAVGVAGRLGRWLAAPDHARRVTDEAATVLRAAIGVLRDEDVRAVLELTLLPRLLATPVGPPLGRLLARVVEDRGHDGVVQLLVDHVNTWLEHNRDVVVDAVARQAPSWSPRVVDEAVATRVHREMLRVAREVAADPDHPLRRSVDRFLVQMGRDLQHDPSTVQRIERLKAALLSHPQVRAAMGDLFSTVRSLLVDAVADPDSELRRRAAGGLVTLGERLATDERLRAKVDGWVEQAAAHVVTTYRDELTATITDTVNRWDGEQTARKVELAVGRDLQFIRINGTVVGALAGLAIHALTQLLL
jgi:uncharacterized membrane-anchored protein YjiN (DUF445 family)